MANNSIFNPGTSLGILDLTLPHSRLVFLCDSIWLAGLKLNVMTLSYLQDCFAAQKIIYHSPNLLLQSQFLVYKCLLPLIHSTHTGWSG